MGNNGHKLKERGVKLSIYFLSLLIVAIAAIGGTYAWIGRSVTLPSTGEIIQGTNSSTLDIVKIRTHRSCLSDTAQ